MRLGAGGNAYGRRTGIGGLMRVENGWQGKQ